MAVDARGTTFVYENQHCLVSEIHSSSPLACVEVVICVYGVLVSGWNRLPAKGVQVDGKVAHRDKMHRVSNSLSRDCSYELTQFGDVNSREFTDANVDTRLINFLN